ncbi:MAG: hypothetical protein LAT63_08875 [Marinobacter sp.]|nr:hypothetical protein [Marinobacter sp.]
MTEGSRDLAAELLELHVKHELASLKGKKLRTFVEKEVKEIWSYADTITLNRISSADQIMGVIRRIVVNMELDPGILELAGELAAEVLNAPANAETTLGDILSRDQAAAFIEEALSLRHHRERFIGEIMSHPVYQELIANVVYHGVVNYLYEDNLITKNVPGVGSVMKFGKKWANKAVPGLDEAFERKFKAWLSDSLPTLISKSEQFLHKALTDDELRDSIMAGWMTVEDRTIASLTEGFGELELKEFVTLGFEFWLSFRTTPYFDACCEAVVNHLFAHYGERPLVDLLNDVGVTQEVVMAEVDGIALPIVEVLREEGYLEAALRRHLAPFYKSAAVKKALAG